MNKNEIEQHLRCAIQQATPNVLDGILSGNYQQDQVHSTKRKVLKIPNFKALSGLIAACFVLILCTGGIQFYNSQYKVSSVIELDVNPSIEMSVNKGNKVLEIKAVNEDAIEILDGMQLKGVELKVAINAVIGSMVQHGYLNKNDADSSILITVSNDDAKNAEVVRKEVGNIVEQCLKENEVPATVFNQQVNLTDQLTELAGMYDIPYGKANFILKLVEKDPSLSMEELALMTMSEIANLIKTRGIDISDLTKYEFLKELEDSLENLTETSPQGTTSTEETPTTPGETTSSEGTQATNPTIPTNPLETTKIPETSAPLQEIPTTEDSAANKVRISNAWYVKGIIRVEFEGLVSWKSPTVSVEDGSGELYPAMITDYQDDYCEIYVHGMKQSGEYTFTIAGIKNKKSQQYTMVIGNVDADVSQTLSQDPTHPETTVSETTQPESTAEFLMPSKPAEKPPSISLSRGTADEWIIKFSKEIEWTAPMITVVNELGNSCVVSILEKKDKSCILAIDGLESGHTYTITISGVTPKNSSEKIELVATLCTDNLLN